MKSFYIWWYPWDLLSSLVLSSLVYLPKKAKLSLKIMAILCTPTSYYLRSFTFRPRDKGLQVSDRQSVFGVYQRPQTNQLGVQEELTSNACF